MLSSVCPLHRCASSPTWLDESLHLLITLNGWLVQTKVGDFSMNVLQNIRIRVIKRVRRRASVHDMPWQMEDVWVSVWFGCVNPCCVCFCECTHVLAQSPSTKRQWSVTIGGVRGQSALIPLPVSVYLSAARCWWLPRVNALDECPQKGKVTARNRSRRNCRMTSSSTPSSHRPLL